MRVRPFTFATALVSSLLFIAVCHADVYMATILQSPAGRTGGVAYGASSSGEAGTTFAGNEVYATYWDRSTGAPVDLVAPGSSERAAYSIAGTTAVGYALFSHEHAVMWNGPTGSMVDLHPAGFFHSIALGASSSNQVGYGSSLSFSGIHALLWTGTAASAVDLNPTGYSNTFANGTSGALQVGWGESGGGHNHALLWNGTAASAIDLNPDGFSHSKAYGVSGPNQAGIAWTIPSNPYGHAALWSGSAASFVDLSPSGTFDSAIYAASGNHQVGYATGVVTDNQPHAFLWSDAANTALDLHQYLSLLSPTLITSYALGIAENGDVIGFASDANFNSYAVKWSLVTVPESGAWSMAGAIALASGCVTVSRSLRR
jgi:hypothetical protein